MNQDPRGRDHSFKWDIGADKFVVRREGLKPYVRPAATADAIYAF
jgi:hypothetical protein